jgi:hypothetical protein
MRTKSFLTAVLIVAMLGLSARAEDLPLPAQGLAVPSALGQLSGTPQTNTGIAFGPPTEELEPYGTPPRGPIGTDGIPVPAQLSDWLTYQCPDCCGPIGCNGPIGCEVYMRTGPSVPVAGGRLRDALESGWLVQGGARTLFLNPPTTAAWTFDFSISTTFNNSNQPNLAFPLVVGVGVLPTNLVTVRNLNRTGINVGLGREWWLAGAAYADGWNWRVGFDAGARYATARLDLNDFIVNTTDGTIIPNGFRRRNDVIGGAFVSLHSDVEFPLGGCKLQTGFRCEWDYMWVDLIHHVTNDISSVNFLLTLGVRF